MTTTSIVTVTIAPTARQLIDGGQCSQLCLLAVGPPRGCTCRCGGEFHGQLLDAAVTVEQEPAAA
ncbi:hypothetical protein [Frankia sp. EAN1pec]|uniref:hypothetical protein n=1 Tax=Parafrankia sp. (strain EAN1pec) TaxID=298653 RepID=UPI0002D341F8